MTWSVWLNLAVATAIWGLASWAFLRNRVLGDIHLVTGFIGLTAGARVMADLATLASYPWSLGLTAGSLLLSLGAPVLLLFLLCRLRRQPLPRFLAAGYVMVIMIPVSTIAASGNVLAIALATQMGVAFIPLLVALLIFRPLQEARSGKRKHHLLLLETAFLAYAPYLASRETLDPPSTGIYSSLLALGFLVAAWVNHDLMDPKFHKFSDLPKPYLVSLVVATVLLGLLQGWLGIWGSLLGLGLFFGITLTIAILETRNHRASHLWWIGAGATLLMMPTFILEFHSLLASRTYTFAYFLTALTVWAVLSLRRPASIRWPRLGAAFGLAVGLLQLNVSSLEPLWNALALTGLAGFMALGLRPPRVRRVLPPAGDADSSLSHRFALLRSLRRTE